MKKVGIIGGGPSGMMAAIAIKRANPKIKVVLLEKKESLGKKLLATGNGRCNFTNQDLLVKYYHSQDLNLLKNTLDEFGYQEVLAFFHSIGIEESVKEGYVYPRSNQANSVLKALVSELTHLQVEIILDTFVREIKREKDFFLLCTDKGKTLSFDQVILASGGRANSALGSDGSGYTLAKSLGHSLVPVVPSLVQLVAKSNPLKKAAGVRTKAKAVAIVNEKEVASAVGELQITDYGISGILIFQISRYISYELKNKKTPFVELDFAPEYEEQEFLTFLKKRKEKFAHLTWEEFLNGLFPLKLVRELLKLSNLEAQDLVSKNQDVALKLLHKNIKHLRLLITDTKGFEMAQVCAGGISTREVKLATMESKVCKNLYLCGELLDVDGLCGGYNLHFAWASGYLAGKGCAK